MYGFEGNFPRIQANTQVLPTVPWVNKGVRLHTYLSFDELTPSAPG